MQSITNVSLISPCYFSYVTAGEGSSKPLILHGTRGCGKTTVLARVAQCCHSWLADCALIIRFANISSQSTTLEQLLRTILVQTSIITTGSETWLKHVRFYCLFSIIARSNIIDLMIFVTYFYLLYLFILYCF